MIKAMPITSKASAASAPTMTRRRRPRERSTTTSVSDEWIEVSRFIVPCPKRPVGANPRVPYGSCITLISHHAQQTAPSPERPLLFDKEWHLFGERALAHRT
jgi:hypothetical protein